MEDPRNDPNWGDLDEETKAVLMREYEDSRAQ